MAGNSLKIMSINSLTKIGTVGESPLRVGPFTYGFENITVRYTNEKSSLSIGSFCSLGPEVTIFLGGEHRIDWITTFPFGHIFKDELDGIGIEGHPWSKGDVNIGNDVWIGRGVTIMSGVTIGSGAVLAAYANITKDVAPYEIVGGNPAKIIKKRFDDEIIALLLKLRWWDFPLELINLINKKLCSTPDVIFLKLLLEQFRSDDVA